MAQHSETKIPTRKSKIPHCLDMILIWCVVILLELQQLELVHLHSGQHLPLASLHQHSGLLQLLDRLHPPGPLLPLDLIPHSVLELHPLLVLHPRLVRLLQLLVQLPPRPALEVDLEDSVSNSSHSRLHLLLLVDLALLLLLPLLKANQLVHLALAHRHLPGMLLELLP